MNSGMNVKKNLAEGMSVLYVTILRGSQVLTARSGTLSIIHAVCI